MVTEGPTKGGTRCPIELLWTAKKISKLWLVDYKLWPIWSSQNLTTVNNRMKILSQGHSFIQKMLDFCTEMKFPPSFMISWWTWARHDYPVSFFLPAITTSQGYISNVFTLSQCSQRNLWDIRKELRLSRLFFVLISIDQGYISEVFNVWKSSQRNVWYSVQLEGKVWYLTQLSSQARDTSIESFLFQSVCNFFSRNIFRKFWDFRKTPHVGR